MLFMANCRCDSVEKQQTRHCLRASTEIQLALGSTVRQDAMFEIKLNAKIEGG